MAAPIIDFISARLDEREHVARSMDIGLISLTPGYPTPDVLLREVGATRSLIRYTLAHMSSIDGEFGCCHEPDEIAAGECREENPALDPGLRALASVYADHADYDPEWS